MDLKTRHTKQKRIMTTINEKIEIPAGVMRIIRWVSVELTNQAQMRREYLTSLGGYHWACNRRETNVFRTEIAALIRSIREKARRNGVKVNHLLRGAR